MKLMVSPTRKLEPVLCVIVFVFIVLFYAYKYRMGY